MKNPFDVLFAKEEELAEVSAQVRALRLVAPLLDDSGIVSILGTDYKGTATVVDGEISENVLP